MNGVHSYEPREESGFCCCMKEIPAKKMKGIEIKDGLDRMRINV